MVPTKHVNPLYILELEQIHAIEWIAPGESIQSRSALARLADSFPVSAVDRNRPASNCHG